MAFKLGRAGQETVLHTFTGGANDGARPLAGVVLDTAGNIYGSTAYGGVNNLGVIYKLTPSGQETILLDIGAGGLAIDPVGNLYGIGAGAYSEGSVIKLDTTGNLTVLYSFTGGADGGLPNSPVTLDAAGNIYGTTYSGGIGTPGAGVVFKIDSAGSFSVLHAFSVSADGGFPYASVTLDAAGNVYGACEGYGPLGGGTVFKIDTAGTFSVVYAFGQALGGYGNPQSAVVLDSAGNIYGTVPGDAHGAGEPSGSYGQVYKIDKSGDITALYIFTGGVDGADPLGLILESNGRLYGTTNGGFFTPVGGGTAFEISLP